MYLIENLQINYKTLILINKHLFFPFSGESLPELEVKGDDAEESEYNSDLEAGGNQRHLKGIQRRSAVINVEKDIKVVLEITHSVVQQKGLSVAMCYQPHDTPCRLDSAARGFRNEETVSQGGEACPLREHNT